MSYSNDATHLEKLKKILEREKFKIFKTRLTEEPIKLCEEIFLKRAYQIAARCREKLWTGRAQKELARKWIELAKKQVEPSQKTKLLQEAYFNEII